MTLAEEVLAVRGARQAVFEVREVDHGSWFGDWDGELAGSDVYIGLMGGAVDAESVRVLLDDWTFEQVAAADVGPLLTRVFSGQATLRKRTSLFFSCSHLLEARVGSSAYSAGRDARPQGELAPGERALTAV
ncbi:MULTISPECIES: hypothetical protein [Streptomyces]|uniref:hypothetical protein n=1 Tax=Streptomyces TaxID=1883 RepID=UPI0004C1CE5B|nr:MULTISPECIES: hypothetical protein [Streptomyces]KOG81185.1 hypothetical protein ADK33_15340 [Streptomyces griseus subsp. rhodochrous]KOU07447.1 hypothetical protein ADK88_10595 [Streptomyces sp. NRRL F-2295]KOU49722.1 hypothetical protein ADK56_17180 [Streptomyces sp. MMG1522]